MEMLIGYFLELLMLYLTSYIYGISVSNLSIAYY
jgi:hypothetical protein